MREVGEKRNRGAVGEMMRLLLALLALLPIVIFPRTWVSYLTPTQRLSVAGRELRDSGVIDSIVNEKS